MHHLSKYYLYASGIIKYQHDASFIKILSICIKYYKISTECIIYQNIIRMHQLLTYLQYASGIIVY